MHAVVRALTGNIALTSLELIVRVTNRLYNTTRAVCSTAHKLAKPVCRCETERGNLNFQHIYTEVPAMLSRLTELACLVANIARVRFEESGACLRSMNELKRLGFDGMGPMPVQTASACLQACAELPS